MTDETDFSPGDVVLDRDDDNPDPALVVNCLSGVMSDEWGVPGDQTVAEANPDYPEDASVVVVVFESDFEDDALEWNREETITLTALNGTPMHHYSFPIPRLVRDEQRSTERPEELDNSTLTDIQHVGDGRAEDLREAGYESVETVATTDQSALAEIDGFGEHEPRRLVRARPTCSMVSQMIQWQTRRTRPKRTLPRIERRLPPTRTPLGLSWPCLAFRIPMEWTPQSPTMGSQFA